MTDKVKEKILRSTYGHELGLLAYEINLDQGFSATLDFEHFVNALSNSLRTSLRVVIFNFLDDYVSSTSQGMRVKESEKDGYVLHTPALAWFSGRDLSKVLLGQDFVSFYPSNPYMVSDVMLLDYLLYFFDGVCIMPSGSVYCTNIQGKYEFAYSRFSLLGLDVHPDTRSAMADCLSYPIRSKS
jgi:hypothetical protein